MKELWLLVSLLSPWYIPVASLCGGCLCKGHPDWTGISQRLDFVYIPIPYQYNSSVWLKFQAAESTRLYGVLRLLCDWVVQGSWTEALAVRITVQYHWMCREIGTGVQNAPSSRKWRDVQGNILCSITLGVKKFPRRTVGDTCSVSQGKKKAPVAFLAV